MQHRRRLLELTQSIHNISNVWPSINKILETTKQTPIKSFIMKRSTAILVQQLTSSKGSSNGLCMRHTSLL
ncbi:hypothetical protein Scep_030385 [Stephania cephalantha]|uniref:Uncharacterized protein n=1 Tax=Stephania cephalantha TaxID=152367 RepID=A0AAP0DZH9_9MAGN